MMSQVISIKKICNWLH